MWKWLKKLRKNKEIKPKSLPERDKNLSLVGYAILIKDPITGYYMWATFNGNGESHTNLSPEQPLIFPGRKLQLGTRIEWYGPKP